MRNEEIRRRCGLQRSLSERREAAVLRWFGHVERMEGERLVKKIYRAEVEGNRGRGRPVAYIPYVLSVRRTPRNNTSKSFYI